MALWRRRWTATASTAPVEYVALRAVLQSASGLLDSCDAMSGLGVVPVLEEPVAMKVAVLGCEREDGRHGDATQREYLQTYQSVVVCRRSMLGFAGLASCS